MNMTFFNNQINKLVSIYGDKGFPEAKIDAVWEIVKPYSDAWFDQAITKLINTCRYAPMPSDFFELAQLEKARTKPLYAINELDKPFPNTNPRVKEMILKLVKKIDSGKGPGGAA